MVRAGGGGGGGGQVRVVRGGQLAWHPHSGSQIRVVRRGEAGEEEESRQQQVRVARAEGEEVPSLTALQQNRLWRPSECCAIIGHHMPTYFWTWAGKSG